MNFTSEIVKLVYTEYLDLEAKAYQDKIRYFERNSKEIKQLPFKINAEIRCDCAIAYFEVGDYMKFLDLVDPLIQLVITENIYTIKGKDIYKELLFRKAASLYNNVEYQKADYVFSELIKMDSKNSIYEKAYTKCSIDNLREKGQGLRGLSIFLFLLAGLIIGFELLVIRTFHKDYTFFVELSRNLIFALAIGTFIFQELNIRLRTKRKINKIKQK